MTYTKDYAEAADVRLETSAVPLPLTRADKWYMRHFIERKLHDLAQDHLTTALLADAGSASSASLPARSLQDETP